MIKLLLLCIVAIVLCKLLLRRWPWQIGRKSIAHDPRDRARALLSIAPDASHADIIEAHKRLITRVHPDRGGTSDLVHEANAARDLLIADIAPR